MCIKIDRLDKTSPLHPNVLIGKIIEVEDNTTPKLLPNLKD